ncbi:MAG: MFS transporter [bacterium]|nr:MFS transporter [bacterium]
MSDNKQVDNESKNEPSEASAELQVSDSNPSSASEAEDLSLWESLKVLFGASKAFWLVNFVSFGDGITYFGILTLLTLFLGTDLGMGDKLAGLAVSTFTGLVTLFVFGGGYISDWLGVRRAILSALLVAALGRGLLAFCPDLPGLGVYAAWLAIVLMAVSSGVLEPALYSGIKEFTDPRTASIGYGILYAIMNLGIVGATFVSPCIRSQEVFLRLGSWQINGLGWGIQGVFWACAGITLAILGVCLVCFTKKVEDRDRYVHIEAKAENGEAGDKKLGFKARMKKMFSPFANFRFVFFIFILLPVRTLFAHQWLTMPTYVERCFPPEVFAKFEWIGGLNPLIIVIFVPLVAALTRKVKVIDMMLVGTTVSALTTFILVPGPNLTLLLTYVVLFSIGEALWSSRFLEYVSGLAPAGQVGAYMGLAGLPWFLAKFTTGLYSGIMIEKFIPKDGVANSEQLWLIYAVIALITPISLLLARKWLLQNEVH